MFDFAVEVRMLLYFGIALVFVDELIKRFRVPFYAFNFSSYQGIYDFESMSPDGQVSNLCSRLEGVEGDTMYTDILEAAIQAGGELGRRILIKLLRPKIEHRLSKLRLKLAWCNIEPVLARINSIEMLADALTNTATLVSMAIIECKLEELGVQPDDAAAIKTSVNNKMGAKDKQQQAEAVFSAAMPLVQGQLTVTKVEALLGTATGLSKEEVLGIVGRAATPLLQRKLEKLGVQPNDVITVSTALEQLVADDNQQKLQAVFSAAMPLVQGQLTVAKVEALLLLLLRLDQSKANVPAAELQKEVTTMIGGAVKSLVENKLSVLGLAEEHAVKLVKLAAHAASKEADARAVFAAAMPLVQGQVTVEKVQVLLLSLLRLKKGEGERTKDDMEALKKEARMMIAGAVTPFLEGKQMPSKIPPWKVKRASMTAQTAASSAFLHGLSATSGDKVAATSAPVLVKRTGKHQYAQLSS
jgi:hypothetical protein